MNARLPQAYRFLVVGLPFGPELLREAQHDLSEDYGVASWWRLVLIAYAGTPMPEVVRWPTLDP